jgi:hypothetical protein
MLPPLDNEMCACPSFPARVNHVHSVPCRLASYIQNCFLCRLCRTKHSNRNDDVAARGATRRCFRGSLEPSTGCSHPHNNYREQIRDDKLRPHNSYKILQNIQPSFEKTMHLKRLFNLLPYVTLLATSL